MIIAIIDIGSNTIRMNVYRVRNGKFRLLFSKKSDRRYRFLCTGGTIEQRGDQHSLFYIG